ncbi:hypothetical protein [Leucobacter sp. USHLN153]|uniref:hypothetical protein n=1 Tax=Leucobacter sp. USHLN153 TaxID=3081268 RepID=UPI0030188B64
MNVWKTHPALRGCAAAAAGAILLASLTACAPEPAADGGAGSDGKTSSTAEGSADASSAQADPDAGADSADANAHATAGKDGNGGSKSWEETGVPGGGDGKSAEVPESFPSDRFVIPSGAVVDDAGERSETEWFIVFRAPDRATGDSVWQAVAAQSGLVAESSEAGDDGSVSTAYRGNGLVADALLIPQDDGTVLLSYDLAVAG